MENSLPLPRSTGFQPMPNIPPAMKTLLLVFFAACSTLSLRADVLADARARYKDGEFAQAAKLFEQSLESSTPQAAVFFELGRSQRQSGHDAAAALSFRRALILDPRFAPARAALEDTNADLAIPRTPPSWRQRVLDRAPLDTLTLAGTIFFWIGAFSLAALVLRQSPARRLPLALAIVCLALGGSALALSWLCDPRISQRMEAMVLTTGGTSLLSAPADQSEKIAALPEGGLVKILSQRGRWFYGQTPDGRRGWFLTQGIVPVIPPA